jgi:hypothetical protein
MQAKLMLVALVTAIAGPPGAGAPRTRESSSPPGKVGIRLGSLAIVLSPRLPETSGDRSLHAVMVAQRAWAPYPSS